VLRAQHIKQQSRLSSAPFRPSKRPDECVIPLSSLSHWRSLTSSMSNFWLSLLGELYDCGQRSRPLALTFTRTLFKQTTSLPCEPLPLDALITLIDGKWVTGRQQTLHTPKTSSKAATSWLSASTFGQHFGISKHSWRNWVMWSFLFLLKNMGGSEGL